MSFMTTVPSPLGTIVLISDGVALTALLFAKEGDPKRLASGCVAKEDAPPFPQARRELGEYFAGSRRQFDIPLAPRGTPFQMRVWEALRRIPHGATATYGDVARAIGSPQAVRAVGAANARNPLAIVIPCHRVVATGGGLGGYAGGLSRKEQLLELEEARRPVTAPARARGRRRESRAASP